MYDYVIIGGGSAGCVLAARLSEDPALQVLLLEAGPEARRREVSVPAAFSRLFKTEVDWDYATAPDAATAGRARYWPRGKLLGGCSSINAMIFARGHRADFEAWAAAGNPGWGYEDVLPYFRRSEDYEGGASYERGVGGPLRVASLRSPHALSQAFVEAAVAAGLPRNADCNGAFQEGAGLCQVTQRRGARESTATAYLAAARRRPNLTVRTRAHVTRLYLEGRRAAGVQYCVDDHCLTVRAEREVILCAGAVGSPHLLLLSGIGPPGALRALGVPVVHALPGVGQHLKDHLAVPVLHRTDHPETLLAAEGVGPLLRYLFQRRGPLTSNIAEALAFVPAAPGRAAPDLELLFAPGMFVDHGLDPIPAHGYTAGPVLLQPESTGTLTLTSPDPFAPPRLAPAYLTEPADLARLREGIRLTRHVLAQRPLAPFRGPEVQPGPDVRTDAEIDAYLRAHVETLYHPACTCRMGPDPDEGDVVDDALRVHGLEGLRVVDASIMPTIVRGHPNAAVIMIAEKAADLIREKVPAQRETARA